MKRQVLGYKMMPKIRPKDAVTHTLKLEKGELVNFMHIGNN